MKDFETRWNEAFKKLRVTADFDTGENRVGNEIQQRIENLQKNAAGKRTYDDGAIQQLRTAFQNNTFIYGTAGLRAVQYGGPGNPAIRVLNRWHGIVAKRAAEGKLKSQKNGANPKQVGDNFFQLGRTLNLYDPGPRIGEYIHRGYQMMDAYFGISGGNALHKTRIPIIAQFIHHAMGYAGPFSMDTSGKSAFEATFPGNDSWGQAVNGRAYGDLTPTQEISRIIRRCVKEFGGTIVFEGKLCYGANIFDNRLRSFDTDKEAQELFKYYSRTNNDPRARFGKGQVEFQWAGHPTAPTRAHFLTNWRHIGDAKSPHFGKVHSHHNQIDGEELEQLMSDNPPAYIRPIWSNFPNFPLDLQHNDKARFIRLMSDVDSKHSRAYGPPRAFT